MHAAIAQPTSIDTAAVKEVCLRFGVRWLAMFGSVARAEARDDSDVDVLYELRTGQVMGYVGLERLAEALAAPLGGRQVDIARPSQLHWYIRDRVLAEAKVLYAE